MESSQQNLRVIYFGTPDFSVPILQNLAEYTDILLVVTQPDRAAGRGKKIQYSAVKEAALELGLNVSQPERIRGDDKFLHTIEELKPDLLVVASFGQILPQSVLDTPRLFSLNVHASILPAYRGASPIQQAILDGLTTSGITFMRMDAGMDTGDIIETHQLRIDEHMNSADLSKAMAELACEKLPELINRLNSDENISFTPQPEKSPTPNTKLISTDDGRLDFENESADQLACRIRAMNPWPTARTMMHDQILKIWSAKSESQNEHAKTGEVIPHPDGAAITTSDGLLIPTLVQAPGKNKMPLADFIRGHRSFIGSKLTVPPKKG